MSSKVESILKVLKDAGAGFRKISPETLGAALAYYTIFSMAPLLIISIAVAGWIFGAQASADQIYLSLAGLVGKNGAQSIQSVVENASQHPTAGVLSSIVGFVVLALGASGVFGQLQDSLNLIWRVQPIPGRSVATILRQRLLSLSIVMVIAFLLLVSLVLTAALSALGKYFGGAASLESFPLQIVNFLASFVVITFLFAAIFKILPDVSLLWGNVWRGSIITALLFTIGKALIGSYLARASVASSFGAAGSLIGVIVWVYYSAAILLFGAEITRAYVKFIGHQVTPKLHSEMLPELDANKSQKAPVKPSTSN